MRTGPSPPRSTRRFTIAKSPPARLAQRARPGRNPWPGRRDGCRHRCACSKRLAMSLSAVDALVGWEVGRFRLSATSEEPVVPTADGDATGIDSGPAKRQGCGPRTCIGPGRVHDSATATAATRGSHGSSTRSTSEMINRTALAAGLDADPIV